MIPAVIARRYATALLELGVETNTLDALVDELGRAGAAFESSQELRTALADPLLPLQAKKAILDDITAAHALGQASKNTINMLLDRRRIQVLPAIAAKLRELTDAKKGLLRAEVQTAMPLPEEYFTQLQQQLERVVGRRVVLDRKLDPSLICGVVVRVGDTVYDGSLISRLQQLRETMLPN